MNAQVGESADGFEGIHGGRGFGRGNQEGERLLELAEAMNVVVLNTQFENRSHVDKTRHKLIMFWLRRRIMDCKVIPNESVVEQHKLVVAGFRLKAIRKRKAPARNRRIKTWKLKGEKARELRSKVERAREVRYVGEMSESPEEIWDDMTEIVVPAAAEVCGRASGKQQQGCTPTPEEANRWRELFNLAAQVRDAAASDSLQDVDHDISKQPLCYTDIHRYQVMKLAV
ncbi:uncharacterized protein [Macrobrachium rosenbergii]|uniref:uncharacterized protein n=1 Tax=Macrobrachium rosenbergii TaxID=79674 RepID=UPI0034D5CB6A